MPHADKCNYPEIGTSQGWCEKCIKEVKPNPNEKKIICSETYMTNIKKNKLMREIAEETGEGKDLKHTSQPHMYNST